MSSTPMCAPSFCRIGDALCRIVAQIFNLLYRRFSICRPLEICGQQVVARLAECNSAIQQNTILRYFRLEISLQDT